MEEQKLGLDPDTPIEDEEPATEQQAEAVAPPPPKPDDTEERIPKGVQKRIDRAVRDKYQAEARAQEYERRLNEMESRQREPAQQQVKPNGAPRIEDYNDINEFIAAATEHASKTILESKLSEQQKHAQAQREQMDRAKSAENWAKKVQAITAELPDFIDVLENSNASLPEHVGAEIMDSDYGPQIAYYLATHEAEHHDIVQLSPKAAARAIGRIEERIKNGALKQAKPTAAPPPITPRPTSGKVEKDPSEMSPMEFAKWRQNFRKK